MEITRNGCSGPGRAGGIRGSGTMTRNTRSAPWHAATQLAIGVAGLALLTFVRFRLGLDLATTAFAYLIKPPRSSDIAEALDRAVRSTMATNPE
jgi:hypothetical protein